MDTERVRLRWVSTPRTVGTPKLQRVGREAMNGQFSSVGGSERPIPRVGKSGRAKFQTLETAVLLIAQTRRQRGRNLFRKVRELFREVF